VPKSKKSELDPSSPSEMPFETPEAPDNKAKSNPNANPKMRQLTSAQKAAAVIVSLGADKASQIYKFMDEEDIEQLTLEVAQLGFLDSLQTEDVLSEYYQMCLTNKAVTEGGIEYARSVLEKAFGEQAASNLLSKLTKSLKNRTFHFLDKADAKSLFAVLQHERPQTIALILSYVDPQKAASVVEQLEPRSQIKVVENMACMEGTSPEAVKTIEAEMAKNVLQHHHECQRQGWWHRLCGQHDEQPRSFQRKVYLRWSVFLQSRAGRRHSQAHVCVRRYCGHGRPLGTEICA